MKSRHAIAVLSALKSRLFAAAGEKGGPETRPKSRFSLAGLPGAVLEAGNDEVLQQMEALEGNREDMRALSNGFEGPPSPRKQRLGLCGVHS